MSKYFYPKLAIINIRKNSKTYFPYLLTCIFTIMMFYILHAISINKGLDGPNGSESIKEILFLGTIIAGIFSAIFLYYTNSFLIKRRKKEIGLYNILGLEKRHIAKVLMYESIFITGISLALGLIVGVIINKLMFLLLLNLLQFDVSLGFSVSMPSIIVTMMVFVGIFLLTFLSNLIQIKLAKPIELLKGSNYGEKEPKSKWIMTLIGLITLGTGYGIALSVKTPLSAVNLFFIAVILVIIGTYALFTAGSIVLLKLLRKNKSFYYKTKNFISISGMIYRMKQNAVGLANICILSSAVLVMLSTTVSLYVGMEDALRNRYPRNLIIQSTGVTKSEAQEIEDVVTEEINFNNVKINNKISYWNIDLIAHKKSNNQFEIQDQFTINSNTYLIIIIPISDYNTTTGKNISLNDDEVIIYSKNPYSSDTISLDDNFYHIKDTVDKPISGITSTIDIIETYILFMNDIEDVGRVDEQSYMVGFDIEENDDINTLANVLDQRFDENNLKVRVDNVANGRQLFLSLYGGLFFIGLFLGALFLMATVLIIYYKQISEGYDDKERFKIMQQVGISKLEIKKTIKSQILMVFFLPLTFAVIHIAVAFPIITKLLAVLNLSNTPLFLTSTIITIVIFAIIYGIVFSLTAKSYYKVVG